VNTLGEDARALKGAGNVADTPSPRRYGNFKQNVGTRGDLVCASNLRRSRQCSGKGPVPASLTGLSGGA
jgi:hypothetical protein